MRERGLKYQRLRKRPYCDRVAPHAGAWIEMQVPGSGLKSIKSLPMRERGLKLVSNSNLLSLYSVAPRAGAWIEIQFIHI